MKSVVFLLKNPNLLLSFGLFSPLQSLLNSSTKNENTVIIHSPSRISFFCWTEDSLKNVSTQAVAGMYIVYVCHLVEGDVLAHHASQAVYEGREGNGTRSITVTPHFCPRAGEIKHCTPLQTDTQMDRSVDQQCTALFCLLSS